MRNYQLNIGGGLITADIHWLCVSLTATSDSREQERAGPLSTTTPPAPNTVTVISPEGTENKDFIIVSDSKSSEAGGVAVELGSNHSGGQQKSYNLPDKHELGSPEPPTSDVSTGMSGDQTTCTVSEKDCQHKMEALSLSSAKETQTACFTTTTTAGSVGGADFVPALFVFGGMDTQETVHGDAFVFVPQL